MAPLVEINAHGWQIDLDPVRGGQIVRCDWHGQAILKPGNAGYWPENLGSGYFPLVPFSNRIRNGTFDFGGKSIRLTGADFVTPHALHGYGWRHTWRITGSSAEKVNMILEHAAGEWPWSYRAHQTVCVGPVGLTLSLCIENLSPDAMPVGIGFHPYFPRRINTCIKMDCDGYWIAEPTDPGLPVKWRPISPAADFSEARPISGIDLDNCFTGWKRHLQINYPDTSLLISLCASEALDNIVVYCPAMGSDILCLEPVSHATNAINLPDLPAGQAMDVLAPGERFSAEILISARYTC
ncbi:MAG: aldose 1-epimerase [Hyphomonas sp.]